MKTLKRKAFSAFIFIIHRFSLRAHHPTYRHALPALGFTLIRTRASS